MAIGTVAGLLLVVLVLTLPSVVHAYSQKWTSDTDWNSGTLDPNVVLVGSGDPAYLTLRRSEFPDWMKMDPATVPQKRDGYCLAWIDTDNSFIMFGGYGRLGVLGDTWKYNFTEDKWTDLGLGTHPSNRTSMGCTYDPVNKAIILFGGIDALGNTNAETWKFDANSGTWTQLFPTGQTPRGLEGPSLAYDASAAGSGRIIMFAYNRNQDRDETWEFNYGTTVWTNRNPSLGGMETRYGSVIAYDPSQSKTLLAMGAMNMTLFCDFYWYTYSSNSWSKIRDCIVNQDPMPGRVGHSMIYHRGYGGIMLFGGDTGEGYPPDTWVFVAAGSDWMQPPLTGSPGGRKNIQLGYSLVDDTAMFFGGYNSITGGGLNDTWALAKGYVQGVSAVWTSSTTPTDAGCDNVDYGNFFFNATKPLMTIVRFQLATSNSPTGPWTFRGAPDGLPGQYYSTDGQAIWSGHNTQRYFRALAQLRTANGRIAPRLEDFTITWACPPAPPFIRNTSPSNNQQNVPIGASIWVNFSEPMNTSTVAWTINPSIPYDFSWSNGDATLELNPTTHLRDCTNYTVQITAGKDQNENLDLVAGPAPNPWTFKTVCINPYIESTDPSDGAFNVPVDKTIAVNFSEPMNTGSVAWTINPTVTLTPAWSGDRIQLLLGHVAAFTTCTLYTVEITSGVDDTGAPLSAGPVPNPWSFFTTCLNPIIVSTDPANATTGVPLDKSIIVTFSKTMNTGTVAWTINPTIALSASWNSPTNTVLTLTHAGPFTELTRYTVRITAGADTGGRQLVPGPVPNPWEFTTAGVNPYIVSTDPANGATNVPLGKSIVVTFSEQMNTGTVTATINPGIALTYSWNSPTDTVLTLLHGSFAQCQVYTVRIVGSDMQGLPLVAGPVPNPWSFRTYCPLGAPRGLTVTKVAPANVLLSWQAVTGATGYKVYETQNRFAAWPAGWNLLTPTPIAVTQYAHAGALTDGLTHYYIVRATDGTQDGPNSTMGVKTTLNFGYASANTNVAWFSLPFVSQYRRASDIANELGSTSIDVVGKWNPSRQASIVYYFARGRWRGTDFPIAAGDGLYLGVKRAFIWNVTGTDANVTLSFTFNGAPKANVNWISLPYTGVYSRASDISTALGSSKITEVGLWNAATQTVTRWYWSGTAWTGTDFAIAPGAGVYLIIASSFTWNPTLVTPAQP